MCSMNPATTVGRHPLSTRFTAIVRIAYIGYPARSELQKVYGAMLEAALSGQHGIDSKWKSASEVRRLASSIVDMYDQVKAKFSVDDQRHYLFTPRELTRLVLGLLRYDLSSENLLDVFAHEARRLIRDRLVDGDSAQRFDGILNQILRGQWQHTIDLDDSYFTSLMGASTVGAAEGKSGEGEGGSGNEITMLARATSEEFLKLVEDGLELFERRFVT